MTRKEQADQVDAPPYPVRDIAFAGELWGEPNFRPAEREREAQPGTLESAMAADQLAKHGITVPDPAPAEPPQGSRNKLRGVRALARDLRKSGLTVEEKSQGDIAKLTVRPGESHLQ